MAATAIGLDIGTNAVRAVELVLGDTPVVRRMGQIGLPIGAVVDGEVADPVAVSAALRRLWTEVGFKKRSVRVAIASARVIVRTVEMPPLPHAELMSTMGLQLDEYVPLQPEDTVFDVRELDGSGGGNQPMRLLLAATHRDVVEPLMMALRDANLDVVAVDVIPAALALALKEPATREDVDVIVSVGAGTVIVLAAHGGEPVFARTVTSAAGRATTEKIAEELSVDPRDAERYKRLGRTEDPASVVAVRAADSAVHDLVEEVRASLAFYAEQPAARPVRRVLVTGGGSLLTGLTDALQETLAVPVEAADPFAGLRLGNTGFLPCDLPYLAPYMTGAIGAALGATRAKDHRIDLKPSARRARRGAMPRRLLAGAGVAVLLTGAGLLYVRGRNELQHTREQLAGASAQLGEMREQLKTRNAASDTSSGAAVEPGVVVEAARPVHIDWPAVEAAVASSTTSLGVDVLSFQGVVETPSTGTEASDSATVGHVTLTATAPRMPVVADWLDALTAEQRFTGAWVSGLASVVGPDGATRIQLTMDIGLTQLDLVTPVEVPGG